MYLDTALTNNVIWERELSQYWEAFLGFLEKFYETKVGWEIRDKEKIRDACLRMEEVHEWQTRKSWKPYHIHPYLVARIYCIAHGKNISETGIIAALLHDNIENAEKSDIVEDYESIKEKFWDEDAIICTVLSKNKAKNKQERNVEYFSRFAQLSTLRTYIQKIIEERWLSYSSDQVRSITVKIAIIKLCDRIHNLWTMSDFKAEKIREKIDETQKYLLPLAKELEDSHPNILTLLGKALTQAEKDYTRSKSKEVMS